MRKLISHTLAVALLWGMFGPVSWAADRPVLRVLNWSEYIDIDIDPDADPELPIAERSPTLIAFGEAHNCEVQYNEFETSEEAMRSLSQTPGYYDVVIIDDFAAEQLVGAGLAKTPDADKVRNLKHLNHAMLQAFDSGDGVVGVPYLYGTTGLLYRKDFYPESIPSWRAFFDPEGGHPVSVFADHKSTFTQALLAQGLNPIAPTDEEIRKAAKFLQGVVQRNHIAAHSPDIEFIQSSVSEGKVGAAVIYSGDALTAMEADPNLGFVLPECQF